MVLSSSSNFMLIKTFLSLDYFLSCSSFPRFSPHSVPDYRCPAVNIDRKNEIVALQPVDKHHVIGEGKQGGLGFLPELANPFRSY